MELLEEFFKVIKCVKLKTFSTISGLAEVCPPPVFHSDVIDYF